ncbi:DUF484 family protein [Vibrio barjaei]|uniref:DUF484 family protein n=1 Tax=Vibrio barjaei TaxID=1676683 RepID=A0ABW7IDQ5_9VIBR|nr:DUF484 family protein [Vibrio barjaei]MCY9873693.1 DUF484 family protein [Vibrio barjaei]OIN24650.1 3',5'-cyclic-nucleotide phosphodiesterase [Vibrio barjaei]
MSEFEANHLTAEVVAQYLSDHPDFFKGRESLVESLSLPHQQQGAVSLVGIQLQRQRERIEALEEEITALMSLAARNDKTFYEFMSLQENLLKCRDLQSVVNAIKQTAQGLNLNGYLKLIDEQSADPLSMESWQRFTTNHLNGKDAYLGRLRQADRTMLFTEQQIANGKVPELGSYVVLPLKRQFAQGLLIFSSEDGGHFQPDMDTLFLRHLALVVSYLCESLEWQAQEEDDVRPSTA